MKILVVGAGYVGSTYAKILARNADVSVIDINVDKVKQFHHTKINVIEESNCNYNDFDVIVIAVNTDYDSTKQSLNTDALQSILNDISRSVPALIVIKSTIPLQFINYLDGVQYNVVYMPEFLREYSSIEDADNPDRIIVGNNSGSKPPVVEAFVSLLLLCIKKPNCPVQYTGIKEAVAIKLHANAYLAARVAFFNELSTFCSKNQLDTKAVITGVCADQRIGNFYNNPSFGFGGSCLPKDTRQLQRYYDDQSIISHIEQSNDSRKRFIVELVTSRLAANQGIVGVFVATSKRHDLNFTKSSVYEISVMLENCGYRVMVYDQANTNNDSKLYSFPVTSNLQDCSVILADRYEDILESYRSKLICFDVDAL